MSKAFWYALNNVEGLGTKTIKKLFLKVPNLTKENLNQNKWFVKEVVKNTSVLERLFDDSYLGKRIEDATKQIKYHANQGIEVIEITSEYYPKILRLIDDPPPVLFCKGNLELLKDDKRIAVIGTRNPTELGYKAGMKISSQFSNRNFIIVSGLALGIDTAGHLGALKVNGSTIAVLAGSLDKIYPKENRELVDDILEKQGLIMSEIPLGGKTFRNSFVKRDRIQSGLSLGICPVQTPLKGGTQHTIKFAQEQRRLLFCPEPLEDKEVEATQGIYDLLDRNVADKISTQKDYEKIVVLLNDVFNRLLKDEEISKSATAKKSNINEYNIEQLSLLEGLNKSHESEVTPLEFEEILYKAIEIGTKLELSHDHMLKQFKLALNDQEK
ncbi:DNA-processing protein DprA [Guptibacillus hwajinpoensis]|uniref:DNA processing protein n=1 Tax=Guptibacillus hwajinpoensis TaxID=208199 RepID=A0ABU0JVD6_9BACL|nr:DNA-processing protein DprA [Alkalihalobacillus hemicentroti]MDQ0481069.1 DNA processing protein [Alkalihalobacillus hemicentroti]